MSLSLTDFVNKIDFEKQHQMKKKEKSNEQTGKKYNLTQ